MMPIVRFRKRHHDRDTSARLTYPPAAIVSPVAPVGGGARLSCESERRVLLGGTTTAKSRTPRPTTYPPRLCLGDEDKAKRPDHLSSYLLRDVPIGIAATGNRRETHSIGSTRALGSTLVRADRYWGASTQRSLKAGSLSADQLPDRFHRSYGIAKKAAAAMNGQADCLPLWKAQAISVAADDLIAGRLSDHFPLTLWQSGSGQETDTNVNEVLANRAIQVLGGAIGSGVPVDAVQDVNMGQSLTVMFTTSLHIAMVMELEETLVPAATAFARALDRTSQQALAHRLRAALARIDEAEGGLHEIVDDDTNKVTRMAEQGRQVMAASISRETGRPFIITRDLHQDNAELDAVVAAMAAVRGLAVTLLDIADLAGGSLTSNRRPDARASLEALSMVCINVMGLDQIVVAACARGNRTPRTLRPIVVGSVLNAIRTLGQACEPARRVFASTPRE
jgi:fumarate hydratase class II